MTTTQLERVEANGLLFDVRSGTSDAKSIQEVVVDKSYQRKYLQIMPGEQWLDLGVNIGAFSCFALQKGAIVQGYEAESENAKLARHNIALNGFHANVIHAAVVSDTYQHDSVYLHLSNTPYAVWRHSLFQGTKKNSVLVPAVRISTILEGFQGVKMDIEGAEIDILYTLPHFFGIQKMCIEYHFNVNDSVSLYYYILERLRQFFPHVHASKIVDGVEHHNFFPPQRFIFCHH